MLDMVLIFKDILNFIKEIFVINVIVVILGIIQWIVKFVAQFFNSKLI
jgi:hypothetical protein